MLVVVLLLAFALNLPAKEHNVSFVVGELLLVKPLGIPKKGPTCFSILSLVP